MGGWGWGGGGGGGGGRGRGQSRGACFSRSNVIFFKDGNLSNNYVCLESYERGLLQFL